ncbi:MAG: glycine oxidase ThiO [Planctomycetaceae bacterium]
MRDVVVVGGGVIGLSIARKLAISGRRVTLLDRQDLGREASWAGAGILPPGFPGDSNHPLTSWTSQTHAMWPSLSATLFEETGIDNGFRSCGGLELSPAACSVTELTEQVRIPRSLVEEMSEWKSVGVRVEPLTRDEMLTHVNGLSENQSTGYRLPDLCQVRNPHHLRAMIASCQRYGVDLRPHSPVESMEIEGSRVTGVRVGMETLRADQFVVAAGAWSSQLLGSLVPQVQVVPVRGQILLLKLPSRPFSSVIECGARYLVPRDDGLVLVGATEEWVGFDARTTPAGVEGLLQFAMELVPSLKEAEFVRSWAGLRPHAPGACPTIGAVSEYRNLHIATGHFRAGLHLSPITAQMIAASISRAETDR